MIGVGKNDVWQWNGTNIVKLSLEYVMLWITIAMCSYFFIIALDMDSPAVEYIQ